MASNVEGLVVKIAGENRSSFIVMLILVIVFVITVAFAALLYVLNRRKLAEAQGRLRKMEEEIKQVDEDIKIANEEKKLKALNKKREALKNKIDSQRDAIAMQEGKRESFNQMLDNLKNWDELNVEGPQ